MNHSEQLGELATALSKAQAEFSAVPKDSKNPFFKSSYAALPEVVKTAGPVISKHGLSISQFLGTDENGADTLTTWLLHSSGQYIAQTMKLHLVKNDPQGQGSATTYARRYSYMAVLGLVADDDDDGNAGSQSRQTYQPKKEQPSRNTVAQNAEFMNMKASDLAAPSPEQFEEITRLAKKKGISEADIANRLMMIDTSKMANDTIAKLKKEVG